MTNSTHDKLYGLDHLRAFAIIFVFLFHYKLPFFGHPDWLKDVAKFGWTGVDLFFVLSGFLISSQLFVQIKQGEPISFTKFFLKRFFRIIPAYWFVLAIYFCFPIFHERESLAPLWKYLTFTQNFGLDIKNNGTFSHAWSLCVEEHFYLLLPIILIGFSFTKFFNRSYWLLVTLFVAGFLIRMFNWDLFLPNMEKEYAWLYWYKHIYYPTYNRLDGLLVGVSIAGLYHFYPNLWSKVSKYGNLVLIFSLLVLTGAYFLCYEEHSFGASIYGFPLIALGYGLMVIGAISPTSFLYKWNSKVTTFIAMISYAIYLTHKGVIHVTQELVANLNIDVNSNMTLFICILTSTLAALLINFTIEKPFMRLRREIIRS
jgi:peptidoglycan/LPS O-acetylase OafA/YrhL